MGPRSDSPVLAPIAGEAMGPPLGQPPFVLSGRKDVSTGSRFRAKRGGPVLAPIAGVAMGPPLGQPPFVLSGRKDMSTGSRFRAKRGGPVLAPIAGEAMGPRRDSPVGCAEKTTERMGANSSFRNDNFGTFGLSGPAWLAVGRAPLSGCRC